MVAEKLLDEIFAPRDDLELTITLPDTPASFVDTRDLARSKVLDVPIDSVTVAETIFRIRKLVQDRKKGYVVFNTVSTVLSARDNPDVLDAVAGATVITPDGMPLVWLSKRAGQAPIERVYGPDLMLALFEATGGELTHYFFGGRDGVAAEMVAKLRERFPDLKVAGYHEPADVEIGADSDDIERINAFGADLVWVGLGHPKQELWMRYNRDRLTSPVLLGVGAAFDFHAGRKKEAPSWMKRSGLQWLHRLVKEPRRLWRRYLVGNSRFVGLLLLEGLGRR